VSFAPKSPQIVQHGWGNKKSDEIKMPSRQVCDPARKEGEVRLFFDLATQGPLNGVKGREGGVKPTGLKAIPGLPGGVPGRADFVPGLVTRRRWTRPDVLQYGR